MRFGVLNKDSIKDKLQDIVKHEKIDIEESAMNELLEIHHDFRQILNTLQCLRSIRFGETIRVEDVNQYLGRADNKLMEVLVEMLETESFKVCYQEILELHRENRVSLSDLIKKLVDYLINVNEINEEKRSKLLDGLAKVEYRIITGSDTEIQLASLIGVWIANR